MCDILWHYIKAFIIQILKIIGNTIFPSEKKEGAIIPGGGGFQYP